MKFFVPTIATVAILGTSVEGIRTKPGNIDTKNVHQHSFLTDDPHDLSSDRTKDTMNSQGSDSRRICERLRKEEKSEWDAILEDLKLQKKNDWLHITEQCLKPLQPFLHHYQNSFDTKKVKNKEFVEDEFLMKVLGYNQVFVYEYLKFNLKALGSSFTNEFLEKVVKDRQTFVQSCLHTFLKHNVKGGYEVVNKFLSTLAERNDDTYDPIVRNILTYYGMQDSGQKNWGEIWKGLKTKPFEKRLRDYIEGKPVASDAETKFKLLVESILNDMNKVELTNDVLKTLKATTKMPKSEDLPQGLQLPNGICELAVFETVVGAYTMDVRWILSKHFETDGKTGRNVVNDFVDKLSQYAKGSTKYVAQVKIEEYQKTIDASGGRPKMIDQEALFKHLLDGNQQRPKDWEDGALRLLKAVNRAEFEYEPLPN